MRNLARVCGHENPVRRASGLPCTLRMEGRAVAAAPRRQVVRGRGTAPKAGLPQETSNV